VLWGAVAILLGLVAGDNILWRVAGWASTHAFVAVGGDIRLELFDHLSGQGTRYFVEQFPGALAGRITAAANAAWLIENALTWTTIPPGIAVIASILVLGTIKLAPDRRADGRGMRARPPSSPGGPRTVGSFIRISPVMPLTSAAI